jgi:hypothetical protein
MLLPRKIHAKRIPQSPLTCGSVLYSLSQETLLAGCGQYNTLWFHPRRPRLVLAVDWEDSWRHIGSAENILHPVYLLRGSYLNSISIGSVKDVQTASEEMATERSCRVCTKSLALRIDGPEPHYIIP